MYLRSLACKMLYAVARPPQSPPELTDKGPWWFLTWRTVNGGEYFLFLCIRLMLFVLSLRFDLKLSHKPPSSVQQDSKKNFWKTINENAAGWSSLPLLPRLTKKRCRPLTSHINIIQRHFEAACHSLSNCAWEFGNAPMFVFFRYKLLKAHALCCKRIHCVPRVP